LEEVLNALMPLWPGAAALLVGAIAISWWAAAGVTRSAIEWGVLVKSACDVYLPELYSKMGFMPASSLEKLQDNWYAFSQAIVYRLPNTMPPRANMRNNKKTQPLD
jgi:hypothetical protein